MRVRTVLATLAGIGVGYVFGTRAGRVRFEELKRQAEKMVKDPDVRQKVAHIPDQVRENLPKAQAAVQDALKVATDKVHAATGDRSSGRATDDLGAGGPAAPPAAPPPPEAAPPRPAM